MKFKINEIFFSVQGESSRAGWPTTFVRTSGCHLRCHYCDTTYAYYQGTSMSMEQILSKISSYPTKFVCVTGGEPLLQKQISAFLTELADLHYHVSLETSGDLDCRDLDPRVLKVIDIKTPGSGEGGRFAKENLRLSPENTEFKFVICDQNDFDWSISFLLEERLHENFEVFFSPSFHQVQPLWLAEKILASGIRVRLQMQLHKYIWTPDTRGV